MQGNRLNNRQTLREWYSFWQKQYDIELKQREYVDNELNCVLEDIMNINKVQLQINWDAVPADKQIKKLNNILKERMSGKPLSKILGYKYFYGLKFVVNTTVLDPRPETEYIVELALKYIKLKQLDDLDMLDLGTGSGCIPISIVKYAISDASSDKDQRIIARALCADICLKALRITEKNAVENDCQAYIECIKSDWLKDIKEMYVDRKFHIITSNPPYLSLDEEVGEEIRFDPKKALYANEDGFAIYRKLFEKNDISEFLKEDGIILIEIPTRFKNKLLDITKNWKYRKFFDTGADNIKIFACSNDNVVNEL